MESEVKKRLIKKYGVENKRRRSFRARHKCSIKKDKTKAGYWACKDLW